MQTGRSNFNFQRSTAKLMNSLGLGACFCLLSVLFLGIDSHCAEDHPGYVSDIGLERQEVIRDLVIIPPPPSLGASLQDRIFNEELTKEFRVKFEEQFGRSEVERVYYSSNRFTYYGDLFSARGTSENISDQKRRFGEYMLKRLAEFHVDNYAKNDPAVRPLWEAKERISHIEVEVRRTKFNARYSIAGNTFELEADHPWVKSKMILTMDTDRFGPGPVNETIFYAERSITKTLGASLSWAVDDGIGRISFGKSLTSQLSTSLSASTYFHGGGKSVRENLYLSGLNYSF